MLRRIPSVRVLSGGHLPASECSCEALSTARCCSTPETATFVSQPLHITGGSGSCRGVTLVSPTGKRSASCSMAIDRGDEATMRPAVAFVISGGSASPESGSATTGNRECRVRSEPAVSAAWISHVDAAGFSPKEQPQDSRRSPRLACKAAPARCSLHGEQMSRGPPSGPSANRLCRPNPQWTLTVQV